MLARDKVNLDIFWVKDHALDDPDLLPPPDEVAAEIVESLETALDRFRNVAKALGEGPHCSSCGPPHTPAVIARKRHRRSNRCRRLSAPWIAFLKRLRFTDESTAAILREAHRMVQTREGALVEPRGS